MASRNKTRGLEGAHKPFVHSLSKEKLAEFRGVSAEAKLQWLEDANRFVRQFVSARKQARWRRLVNGAQKRPEEQRLDR